MQASDVVLRFLESIGRGSEAAYYLDLFRDEEPESFAAIVADDDVVQHDRDALILDLRYLARLGLRPVIVLDLLSSERGFGELLTERMQGYAEVWLTDDVVETRRAARSGALPVSRLETFDELGEMTAALKTRKIIFLGRRGGLSPAGGSPLSLVDLNTEYEQLMREGVLPEEHRLLVRQARNLIDRAHHPMTIAVTTPLQLLRELFTVHGAGTLLRRGAKIRSYRSYDQIDRDRLDGVMRSAFGEPPRDPFYERPVECIYVAGEYDGAAIVAPTPLVSYLSKFAVDRRAQGEGIGRDLWRALSGEHPGLVWRSRHENAINSWYLQRCDGMVRVEDWCIFWRQLSTRRIPEAIEIALAQPRDFPAGQKRGVGRVGS